MYRRNYKPRVQLRSEKKLHYLFFPFKIICGLPSLNPFLKRYSLKHEIFSLMLQYEKFTLKREIHWLIMAARE